MNKTQTAIIALSLLTACNAADMSGPITTTTPQTTPQNTPGQSVTSTVDFGQGQTETCVPSNAQNYHGYGTDYMNTTKAYAAISCDFSQADIPGQGIVSNYPNGTAALSGYVVTCFIGPAGAGGTWDAVTFLRAYYNDGAANPIVAALPSSTPPIVDWAPACRSGSCASNNQLVLIFPTKQTSPQQMCAN